MPEVLRFIVSVNYMESHIMLIVQPTAKYSNTLRGILSTRTSSLSTCYVSSSGEGLYLDHDPFTCEGHFRFSD